MWMFSRIFCMTGCVVILFSSCMFGAVDESRKPAVAGAFYPSDPRELTTMVDDFLKSASPRTFPASGTRIVGIVVPHAGYIYSGQTAAIGFKAIGDYKFDRVYFLGVDHHCGLPVISLWTKGGFETPSGSVPVDVAATDELLKAGEPIRDEPAMHLREHSLEVMMPFFLKTFGQKPAIFATVGGLPENGIKFGKEIIRQLGVFPGKVLIIASSDWSHYHDQETAKGLDDRGLKSVLAVEPEKLLEDVKDGKTELCGLNPVLTLLTVMKAVNAKATLLDQTDSAKASGDASRVVGYASVLFQADSVHMEKSQKEEISLEFKTEALNAVRKTIESYLSGGKIPEIEFKHSRFSEKCGVFVTLRKRGELRGCIGMIEGRKPLAEGIQTMAIAAATDDPRFPAVTSSELKEISIEISVLTPPVAVNHLDEIVAGRDGVILRKGYNSGVFLPQVATEQGWNRDTFLDHLDLKAGLPVGSHKEKDAKLFKFTADVFGEKE